MLLCATSKASSHSSISDVSNTDARVPKVGVKPILSSLYTGSKHCGAHGVAYRDEKGDTCAEK